MDRPVKGKTLLVGEGDFSFTVAMVTKFPVTTEYEVISTSIETAESILKHKNATENMKLLKEQDIRVCLEVDATTLHQHHVLKDEKFSRIIFNFPHAGGKSNHKRNRKLLNDFFASAVHVLEKEGQILMTLCKGQGGTPADRPMRAWHDSWQVISMAANSSLILVETIPFQVEDYETYTSTGFRSLDKGFHTDSAITHVFEEAEPVRLLDIAEDHYVTVSDKTYTCSQYVYNKLQVLREIEALRNHPFKVITLQLTSLFTTEDRISQEMFDRTCMFTDDAVDVDPVYGLFTSVSGINEENLAQNNHYTETTDLSNIFNHHYKLKKTSSMEVEYNKLTIPLETLRLPNTACKYDSNHDSLCLRTSLLDKFKVPENLSERWPHIESGPVFRPCFIQTGHLPVQYQMLIIWQASNVANKTECNQKQINDTENNAVTKERKAIQVENEKHETDYVETSENDIGCLVRPNLKGKSDGSVTHVVEKTIHNLKRSLGEAYNIEFHNQPKHKGRSELPYVEKVLDHGLRSVGYFVVMFDDEFLDSITVGELIQINQRNKPEYSTSFALVLFLDDIASLKFNIKIKRLLYSLDKRVTNQFLESDSVDGCLGNAQIKIPSLYPMTFVHDMSFWENERLEFDEVEFCDIIRNIADDTVVSVELIDSYKDPETGRLSRCYRMMFQSLDKALCYDTSWKLQSIIRLEVEKHLKITLR